MNQPADPSWAQHDHFDPMELDHDIDFSNFLNGELADIDLSTFDVSAENALEQHSFTHLPDATEIQFLQEENTNGVQQHGSSNDAGLHLSAEEERLATGPFDANNLSINYGEQRKYPHEPRQHYSVPQEHNRFQPQSFVPPTPNSVEMHGDRTRYLQQMDSHSRAIYEQQFQLRQSDLATFTPLVSPAVTAQDTRFQVPPDLTINPGVYLSPLTSPALEGQTQENYPSNHSATTNSSSGESPAAQEVDMLEESALSALAPVRASKRRTNPARGATARVKQSPIVKPHRRKSTLTGTIQSKDFQDLLGTASKPIPTSSPAITSKPAIHILRQHTETHSVSPDPLHAMGPPPKPSSALTSPNIVGQSNEAQASQQNACPATPASLMQLRKAQNNSISPLTPLTDSPSFTHDGQPPVMDDLTLPEAADTSAQQPPLARIDTSVTQSASPSVNATPRLSARKTPKLGPLSTPSGHVSGSTRTTPLESPQTPTSTKRPDAKRSGPKKRGSTSGNTLVSPALRPKISPSIKPLLPEGASTSAAPNLKPQRITDDQAALLLTWKSNYQHLIEGTCVPGVEYPEALSENLTSKRTSHKLAEQGRRNRINLALHELGDLLPKSLLSGPPSSGKGSTNGKSPEGESGDRSNSREKDDEGGGKGNGNSKAATVESAIAYIKLLQEEQAERARAMEEKDKELETLRKRLITLEGEGNGIVSNISGGKKQDKKVDR